MRSFEYGDWVNLLMEVIGLCAIIMLVVVLVIATIEYNRGYQMGQIDAINGSIHWQLEKQADGSMQWNECDGVCKR